MARFPYALYKRRSNKNARFSYYVQFWDPEARVYLTGRSVERLRELMSLDPATYSPTKKPDSRLIAQAWLEKYGVEKPVKEIQFGDYCLQFWDWEQSSYIRALRLRGRSIGKEYVMSNHSYIKRYLIASALGDTLLSKVTSGAIESFILEFKQRTGLSNTSCNALLCTLGKPLSEALRLGMIRDNPIQRVPKLQKDNVVKGLLTSLEIKSLFNSKWDNDRIKIAAMISLACGLRLGEVIGLRHSMIESDRIVVSGSYSKKEGLKSTKNGKTRVVFLPKVLYLAICKLKKLNPYKNDWVFWSEKEAVPIHGKTIETAFYAQLGIIGIKDAGTKRPVPSGSRQARNITFHSLRHLYNTLLRGTISDENLRESTGHLTKSMTDHYDHADHDIRLKETAVAVEARILPFIA